MGVCSILKCDLAFAVARLSCRLADESYEMALDLDVNSDLCPLENNDRFTLALAKTLSPDGAMDTGEFVLAHGWACGCVGWPWQRPR